MPFGRSGGRVCRGGFQTRPYMRVVENEYAMYMIRHYYESIED